MSGSENGGSSTEPKKTISPGRVLGARSASPAKRSAADMEGGDKAHVPGSFTNEHDGGHSDFDHAMRGFTPANNDSMDTQETGVNSLDTSARDSMTTNTSATSFQSEALPPYTVEDGSKMKVYTDYTTAQIDEQEAMVRQKAEKPMDEGQKGIVVSIKWLQRVLSRSSEGLKRSEFTKDAREGLIGPVDNSDIVPEGAFDPPFLHDMERRSYIPLRTGLSIGSDYEVFNDDAWGVIVGAYGIKPGQHQIDRYVRNTAPPEASHPNLQYEVYPPTFTIRKVPQPTQDTEELRPSSSSSALQALRMKAEQRTRGQNSPDDAVRLVSSRVESFQKFLARSKEAAGILRNTKVKIWKLLDPSKVAVDQPDNHPTGVMSPTDSSSMSTKAVEAKNPKLVIDLPTFNKMDIGTDLEHIDAKDETTNSNYNGSSTMELYQLFQDETLLLEEMIGGPGGGDFASDNKKLSAKSTVKKSSASKPGSASASARTSPAPGMMTRGRTRRDGRTRGVVGLTNLGNTCYMNSALQCIRSVEELAIYFLSEKYKPEINYNNPLGHKGAMAKHYAGVLQGIYADNSSGTFTPTAFKKTLGSLQPLFSGYGQQDSQEFLSFLVDALHEDLNRIVKKPYNENPDSDDKTVHDPQAIIELGEIYRKNHRARNDSVAMDLFSGFYKNTMECPVCDKISITFDPFSLVTVQLPIENTFQHSVTFFPLRDKPVNRSIDIDKNATIKTLKEYIASKHAGVQADRLWMVEVYSHKLYKVFEDQSTLAEAGIQTNDYLFIFELEDVPSNPPAPEKKAFYTPMYSHRKEDAVPEMDDPKADCFAVPIFSRQKNRFGSGWDIIQHPIYITLSREEAQDYEIIIKKVLVAVSRMTSRPILTELGANTLDESMDKDESAAEDSAQVSDRSVPSEDGYVEVSVNKSGENGSSEPAMNGNGSTDAEGDRPIPPRFMELEHPISEALRNQLFALNYAPSDSGSMYCTGMTSFSDRSVRNMFERVKRPVRRVSVQSSSSGDESTTSTRSGTLANGESEESDADDSAFDKPDITLGDGTTTVDGSDAELPDDPLLQPTHDNTMSRKGRRKNNKRGGKGRRNKQKTYGKNDKRANHQNRPGSAASYHSTQSHRSLGSKSLLHDDNPYYIKLGEGIVLDWYPEALDSLFGGHANDEDETRGHFVSQPDGRGLPFVQDPEVEAKKSRREARKKNGITLEDCFVETGKREVLSEDNAWYCGRCKELRRATKTLEIWTIPDILVVHLKRFGGNRSFRDKIDVFVDYPIEELDMTDRVGLKEDGKEYVYDLFAVDNHYGGLGGGHYTAMAKNFYDGQWYDYNDSSCSKLGESRLHSAAAYLLFYRRRSDKPLGPQYLQDLVNEARNPQQVDNATEEAAEESDSGEGRLGGPNGSLLGSSSVSGAAGVGAVAGSRDRARDGGQPAGAGQQADNTQMTRTNSIGELNGQLVYGPQRPPHLLEYGDQGSSWDFKTLDDAAEADDGAETLMHSVDDHNDDDAASTTAEMDNTGEEMWGPNRMGDFDDYEDTIEFNASSAGRTTPNEPWNNIYDDHSMYSSGRDYQDADGFTALHLEDAGGMGSDGGESEAAEIYPDSPASPPPMEHDKMD